MNEIAETMIDDLDPYVAPNSYPPKYNPRKVADYCKEMGIEDPSTLTKEQRCAGRDYLNQRASVSIYRGPCYTAEAIIPRSWL